MSEIIKLMINDDFEQNFFKKGEREMLKKIENKPVPIRISDWNTGKEIIYGCPKCGTSFSFYRDGEHFCHGCGNQIDWSGVPTYLTDEQKKREKDAYSQYQTKHFNYKKYKREVIEILLDVYKSYV